MRGWLGMAGLLVACSGGDDAVRKDPEICDDGIDNNADGLIDCDDKAACGGLVCRDPGGDDDDTSVDPPDVEVIWNPEDCCDFTFDCPGGDTSVGTFTVVNHLADVDAEFDVKCDFVGPSLTPMEFQLVGSSQAPVPSLIDADLYAERQVVVEMFFVCKTQLTQSFETVCNVHIESEDEEWDQDIPVNATHE